MREQQIGETFPRAQTLTAGTLHLLEEFRAAVVFQSMLVWGEHCSECAAPECYVTCSLYDPRPDNRCRRFVNGIESVPINLPHSITPALRVLFKQWGKLEAEAKPCLFQPRTIRSFEAASATTGHALSNLPAPRYLRAKAGRLFDKITVSYASRRGAPIESADHFAIEAINLGQHTAPFTFSVLPPVDASTMGLFQRRFDLQPGYNRILIPIGEISSLVPLADRARFLVEPIGDPVSSLFLFTTLDAVRLRCPLEPHPRPRETPPADEKKKVKCVIWDLDNTLWRGTLVEDGPERLTIPESHHAVVEELDRRGILQSIASKNDRAPVLEVLERFGLKQYFLSPQIGWGPKSESISAIQRALDIGIDTFIFIDDQAFERAEVKAAHPGVRVMDASDLGSLLERVDLEAPLTSEAATRRIKYVQEQERLEEFAKTSASYQDFLVSCDIKLTLDALDEGNFERAFELTQRTNQLNYTGRRYERSDLQALLKSDAATLTLILSCADRFGDYGVIGLAVLETRSWTIEDLFMSCRVQRKMVENALFSTLLDWAAAEGARELKLRYRKTARNAPARRVLDEIGWRCVKAVGDSEQFILRAGGAIDGRSVVKVLIASERLRRHALMNAP